MRNIYTSVDIGSDTVKIIVGEIFDKKLNVLATSIVKSRGVKKGVIVDANEIMSTLKKAIEEVENKLMITIDKVIATVPSYNATFEIVNGEISIDEDGLKVTGSDITDVLKNSIKGKIKEGRELVTITPIYFSVDERKHIKDPKGMICKKLGVKAMMITTPSKNVDSVISIFAALGIDVLDINIGSICDYEEFRNSNMDKELCSIINIGSDITTVSLFNKGIIVNSEIIQIGGKNIDNDISYVFKTTKEVSADLKENFAVAHKKFSRVNEVKDCMTENNTIVSVNQYDISQVVMSRLTEILKLAKKQSYLLTNKEISYIIITGGISEMPGISYLIDEMFSQNVKLGNIDTIGIRNNKYSTASGLIRSFNSKLELRDSKVCMVDIDSEKTNVDDNSVMKKVFGYFFDN